jgi:hypothetical protein
VVSNTTIALNQKGIVPAGEDVANWSRGNNTLQLNVEDGAFYGTLSAQ